MAGQHTEPGGEGTGRDLTVGSLRSRPTAAMPARGAKAAWIRTAASPVAYRGRHITRRIELLVEVQRVSSWRLANESVADGGMPLVGVGLLKLQVRLARRDYARGKGR
jgi:hypothetical protein